GPALIPVFAFAGFRRSAHPAATAHKRSFSPRHLFGARNGIFCRRDCGAKSAVCPSGERETQRTHWKSPPSVGIFGASPHVGRKRECVVGATGIEPVTPTMSR